MRRLLATILVALTLAAALVAAPAPADAATARGTIRIAFSTPRGVAATVVVTRIGTRRPQRLVVAKPPKGASGTRTVRLAPGRYRVTTATTTRAGARYTGPAARLVSVRPGRTARVAVRLRAEGGAAHLRTASVSTSAVVLRWNAPKGTTVLLRRAPGLQAPASVRSGTAIPTVRGAATDRRVRAGTAYAYSLFTRQRGRWTGPLTLRLQTPAAAGAAQSSYVAAPDAVFLPKAAIARTSISSAGVTLALSATAPRPAIGSPVVVPPVDSMPGGFIGIVTAFTADGSPVLAQAGLGDVLTKYHFSSAAFTSDPSALPLARVRAELAGRRHLVPYSTGRTPGLLHAARESGGGPLKCEAMGSAIADATSEITRRLTSGGTFDVTGDMAARRVTVDATVFVDASLTMDLNLKGAQKCKLELHPIDIPLVPTPPSPVPINLSIKPVVELSSTGEVHLRAAGLTAHGGVEMHQTVTVGPGGPKLAGTTRPIVELHPVSASTTAKTQIQLRLGGDLLLGVGTSAGIVGFTAGVFGEIDVLDGTVGVGVTRRGSTMTPASCMKLDFGLRGAFGLEARAFFSFGILDAGFEAKLQLAEVRAPYGAAIALPSGCSLDEAADGGTSATPVGTRDDATAGGGSSGDGSSGGGGGGGGGWGDGGTSSSDTPPVVSRPLGDGATTALPADAGDQVAWRTLTGHVTEDTTLGGDVAHSGWLLDNVVVDPGVTLTVAAGTRLKFFDRHEYWGTTIPTVRVEGTVDVQGTAAEPVLLSSWNDTAVGGTTGRENQYVDRNGIGASYHAFVGGTDGVVRIVHAFVSHATTLATGGAQVDVEASGFADGARLADGAALTLRQLQASSLTVGAFARTSIEDATLTDSSVELRAGAMQDVALTGASRLQVEGPDVRLVRMTVAASALPVSATIGGIAADYSGLTSPDGTPWLAAEGGTVPIDLTVERTMPIAFSGRIAVLSGITLTVPHGAVLAFPGQYDLFGQGVDSVSVAGRLVTSGTGAAPVFTARSDPDLPAGMSAGRNRDGWNGIRVVSGGEADLRDVDLRGSITARSGGTVTLHGRIATADPAGTAVVSEPGGTATLAGVTGSALSVGGAVSGGGRVVVTDSSLTDSSVATATADSTVDDVTMHGTGSSLTASPFAVNAYRAVRFLDGAPDEVRVVVTSGYAIGGGDQHWTTTVPISVASHLELDSSTALTIDPGVTLRLGPCSWGYGRRNSCFRLTGAASLKVLGTAADPVRIEQQHHPYAGDPSLPLAWLGIEANGTSTVELRHVRASGAEQILRTADDAAVTIDDLQHEQDAGSPQLLNGSRVAPTITDSPGIG